MKWILKHLKLLITVVVLGVTAIVVSAVMISSYVSYKNYEKTYYANDLEVRSAAPAAPKSVNINNKFKSSYKKNYVFENENEGDINLPLYLDAKSFADIVIVFNSDATDDLLSNMNIKVNNSAVESGSIKVGSEEEEHVENQQLVLANFALPEGEFTLKIAGVKNKTMPEIGAIAIFTSAAVSFAA